MLRCFELDKGPRRILAVDGGGVRGALAVGLITKLEATLRQKLGRPNLVLSDYFDLIGGTSTGAIIAAGLALGRSADDLAELHRHQFEVLDARETEEVVGNVYQALALALQPVNAFLDPAFALVLRVLKVLVEQL